MIGNALIVILGATAVGKTQLAIDLAQALNGEIIGADSRQIYRYMDIGTAKPSPDQLASVPHHLIDVVNPDENLTLADYQTQAYAAITDIHQRGKLPFLVGGTGQYITAVVEGWRIPRVAPNFDLRNTLEAEAQAQGVDALHQRLADVDPEAAANIHPNNVRRVIRALEVYLETGQPISELQRKHPPPYEIYTLGLTLTREHLYERADQRVDLMMESGFLEEVQQLLQMGYDHTLPSMSGLGYLELVAHLRSNLSLEDAINKTKFSTHDFIRKQDVWFRGHDHGILWHNVEQLSLQSVLHDISTWLEE